METGVNERTPLLIDGQRHNQQSTEANLPEEATTPHTNYKFDEQEPMDGIVYITDKQTPEVGNDASSCGQTPPVGEGTSSNPDQNPLVSSPRNFVRKTNCVSHDEIVQALYSAWQRNRQPKREITLKYFTTKEICAMHIAMKNVTRGRRISNTRPHQLAESLATAIAKELLSEPESVEGDISVNFQMEFASAKILLTASLLNDWSEIERGGWFPDRYTETIFEDSDEQPPAVSDFWIRQVETYDKVRDFFLNPKLQTLVPMLLFFWPLSVLAIGSKYVECQMGA